MTIEEAETCIKRLQSYYPNMAKLDELAVSAWMEEIGPLRFEDCVIGIKEIARVSKFFPSIAEVLEAINQAAKTRFQAEDREDREEREERLALQAAEDEIMTPGSKIHRVIQGPNHQRFIDMIEGRVVLPKPDWKAQRAAILAEKGTK